MGVDHVTMQPASKNGYKGITVIVNLFSGHTELYPYKNSTAEHDAVCLHDYFSRYGRFDEVHTDPGTDFIHGIGMELRKRVLQTLCSSGFIVTSILNYGVFCRLEQNLMKKIDE